MNKAYHRIIRLLVNPFIVLGLAVIILGATGFSDKMLGSIINEETRELRISLAQTIRDPEELDKALEIKRTELIALHGLDRPWYFRLPENYLRIIKLDLGEAKTIRTSEGSGKISEIILERLPRSVLLMTTSFLLVAIFCILFGAKMATKAGSRLDKATTFSSAISFATPAWWLGILFILIFGYYFAVLPTGGMYSTPPPAGAFSRFFDLLKHAILPILTLVAVIIGGYFYTVRNITLRTAQEGFVSYARSRGFSEKRIIWRYILRPSAPPIVTGFIFGLFGSFSGAILTETVFKWPGMGILYKEATLGTPDEGLIIALTFVYAMLFATARIILEALYLRLDPRIRY